jgi:hypothetical protein
MASRYYGKNRVILNPLTSEQDFFLYFGFNKKIF